MYIIHIHKPSYKILPICCIQKERWTFLIIKFSEHVPYCPQKLIQYICSIVTVLGTLFLILILLSLLFFYLRFCDFRYKVTSAISSRLGRLNPAWNDPDQETDVSVNNVSFSCNIKRSNMIFIMGAIC